MGFGQEKLGETDENELLIDSSLTTLKEGKEVEGVFVWIKRQTVKYFYILLRDMENNLMISYSKIVNLHQEFLQFFKTHLPLFL